MKLSEKVGTLKAESLELMKAEKVVRVGYLNSSSILNKPMEAIAKNSKVL